MKQQREIDIKREFESWVKDKDTNSNTLGLQFYIYLQNERPDLLSFKCSGDKYQDINALISNWVPRSIL